MVGTLLSLKRGEISVENFPPVEIVWKVQMRLLVTVVGLKMDGGAFQIEDCGYSKRLG